MTSSYWDAETLTCLRTCEAFYQIFACLSGPGCAQGTDDVSSALVMPVVRTYVHA